ncbi:MAG: hypothetical protein NTZ95_01325 [Candidatus Omnitrophica bacterium]|nr:hypothetical protein [Candidatus Omnitrophota bacterium]
MEKIIIWFAVIVIIFLMGLDVVQDVFIMGQRSDYYTTCYGFKITPIRHSPSGIEFVGQYKYQLIVATLLVGFALYMSVKPRP